MAAERDRGCAVTTPLRPFLGDGGNRVHSAIMAALAPGDGASVEPHGHHMDDTAGLSSALADHEGRISALEANVSKTGTDAGGE